MSDNRPVRLLCLGSLLSAMAAASTAQTSPWWIGASLGLSHETNVFRASDSQPKIADTIVTASLLAGLDQPIGRQRIRANVSLRDNRFQDRSDLNNFGYGASAALDWSTIGNLSGTASLSSNQSLASFNPGDSLNIQKKNVQRNQAASFGARLGGAGRLQIEGSLGWNDISYSASEFNFRELEQLSGSLGATWTIGGVLKLGATVAHTDGEYPLFTPTQADEFKRDSVNLSVNWKPSGASTLVARVGSTRQRHDLATSRDFSGTTGLVRWNWAPGGRTEMRVSLARDVGQENLDYVVIGPITGETDISRVTTSLTVNGSYSLSAKVGIRASATYFEREISDLRFINGTLFSQADLRDRGEGFSIGATWSPLRVLSISCDFGHQRRRNTSQSDQSYRYQTVGCTAQAVLQ